jgi:RNA polymerase sigma-70 factor (ECF subfamily)
MSRGACARHKDVTSHLAQDLSVASAASRPERAFVAAAQAGDAAAFSALAQRYRAELQLHCYRMLGSLHDAEDVVQDTLLRAWAKRATYQGRSTFRAWLYGIATNACLDVLRGRAKRLLPSDVFPPADPDVPPGPTTDLHWLEPFPDVLLDQAAANDDIPEARILERETTELAFLAAIQHLPPRPRAVLILRDVLEWSAKETAEALDTTVASVNSALQRAHARLAEHLPVRGGGAAASDRERVLLGRLIDAWEHGDPGAMASLLTEDARLVMPPTPSWFQGREAIVTFFREYAFSDLAFQDRVRAVATGANRQPAAAIYLRRPGEERRAPFALVVIRAAGEAIAEMTLFRLPELVAACGLPATM